jgi:putative nucleotidyltransferase with HDIG domain
MNQLPEKTLTKKAFLAIVEQANKIVSENALHEIPERLAHLIRRISGASAITFFRYHLVSEDLTCEVIQGEGDMIEFIGDPINFSGRVAMENLKSGKSFFKSDIPHDEHSHAIASFPIFLNEHPFGVLQIFDAQVVEFELVQLLGNRIASEIDKWSLLEAVENRSQRLEALVEIIGSIGSTLDRDQVLQIIVDHAHKLLGAEATSLFLVDEEKGDIYLHIASNMKDALVRNIRVPAGHGIIGHVVESGETVIVDDASTDQRFYQEPDQTSGFQTRSILAVPMLARTIALGQERGETLEKIIGGLEALNKKNGAFTDDDAQLLAALATQAATVSRIAQSYADLNELFIDVIKVLTEAIDAKDPYTRGHSQRVSQYAVAIARELNVSQSMMHHIRVGGILHDVGKIGISDNVLKKPGKLTAEEYDEMKKHPTIGVNIMKEVRLLDEELRALYEHHERLDGSGYPRGLSGNEISLMGRIMAVADVFDAMTTDRPYRDAIPPEEVLEHLRNGIDTDFDPACVHALEAAYKNGISKIS